MMNDQSPSSLTPPPLPVSPRPPRGMSILYILVGAVIGLPMTMILVLKADLLLDPAAAVAAGTVKLTVAQAEPVRWLLLAVWVFGMSCLLHGLLRLFWGKRITVLRAVMLGAALASIAGFYFVTKAIGV